MNGENPVYLSKTIYGGETVRYYKRTYPETVTNIIYDNEQNSIESTTISEYNEYRDLVKSWDAYANGDKTNTEHMTSYTYDDVYHTQLTKEYKETEAQRLKRKQCCRRIQKFRLRVSPMRTEIWLQKRHIPMMTITQPTQVRSEAIRPERSIRSRI